MIFLTLFAGFLLWYVIYSIECFANMGTPVSLYYVWEEFLWFLPGGSNKKAELVKDMVGDTGNGVLINWSQSWTYEEVRKKNLYKEVGNAILPGRMHFIILHILVPLLPTLIMKLYV